MNEIELYKKQCNIKKTLVDPYILDAIGNALSSGELDLSGYAVGLSSWEVISCILLTSETIKKLKFGDCMIPPLGIDYLLNALMTNNTILEVNLYGNNISSNATIKLGKMLAVNKSIKMLTLNWNNIGESLDTFSAFCDGLSKNESLEYLDLRNNQICSSGASNLSTALQFNKTLKCLDLRWNRLKNKGVECLQNAMKYNNSLQELLIKGNFVHFEKATNIELCVKQNEEVQNMKMEYDLKISFLLKELKKLEDTRVRQIAKITQLSQQQFIEMETKFDDITQLLLKKEEQLKIHQLEKRKLEKEVTKGKEKFNEIKVEVELVKRRNNSLEKELKEKLNEYLKTINEMGLKLQYQMGQNEKLLQEINDKNIAIENLNKDIEKLNICWELRIKEKTAQVEHNWKVNFEDMEDKFSKQIAELRRQIVEKELIFLKEDELKLKDLRSRAEDAEKSKSLMKTEISSLQMLTKNQETRILKLVKELNLISTELATAQQDLKNEQEETKKNKEALNKVNADLNAANQTIEKLKYEVHEEKEKVRVGALKLKEVNSRIIQMKEEEKVRSDLLASAMKSYLRSSGDLYFTV